MLLRVGMPNAEVTEEDSGGGHPLELVGAWRRKTSGRT